MRSNGVITVCTASDAVAVVAAGTAGPAKSRRLVHEAQRTHAYWEEGRERHDCRCSSWKWHEACLCPAESEETQRGQCWMGVSLDERQAHLASDHCSLEHGLLSVALDTSFVAASVTVQEDGALALARNLPRRSRPQTTRRVDASQDLSFPCDSHLHIAAPGLGIGPDFDGRSSDGAEHLHDGNLTAGVQ